MRIGTKTIIWRIEVPNYKTHPRFRDICLEIATVRRYKSGFVDLKIWYVYHNSGQRIFPMLSKIRLSEAKWREFRFTTIGEKMVKSYRTKPCVIRAIEFLGDSNKFEVVEFMKGTFEKAQFIWSNDSSDMIGMEINTLEGTMRADVGDFIIEGLIGEFYPCKPDVFHKKYELANLEE